MTEEIWVSDKRTDDQLGNIPRITTFAQLTQLFGLSVNRSKGWDATANNKACWKLIGFEVRLGVAAYIPQVLNVTGTPMPQILVCRWWPSVNKFDQPVNPHYGDTQFWDGGFTDANGVIGMAYGGGSVTGPNGGPDRIWVSASPPPQEPQYSDAAINLGWIGGTDHLTANPIFQYVVKEDVIPPPPGNGYRLNISKDGKIEAWLDMLSPANQSAYDIVLTNKSGDVLARAPMKTS